MAPKWATHDQIRWVNSFYRGIIFINFKISIDVENDQFKQHVSSDLFAYVRHWSYVVFKLTYHEDAIS